MRARPVLFFAAFLLAVAVCASAAEDGDVVQRGRELYKQKAYDLALDQFEAARRETPHDPQAALLTGLTALRLDRPTDAAAAWADYAAKSPDRKLADDVSQYTTILLAEAYRREAMKALASEQQLAAARTDPHAVAVVPFRGLGTPEYAPLGKAISAMLIDNLQGVPDLHVLEREQVQALLEEAKLGESGLVEAATAVRTGKLLRAGRIAAGSHIDWTASPPHLKISAAVFDVDGGKELDATTQEGMADHFFELVPKVSAALVPPLAGKNAGDLPNEQRARVEESHTKSLPAVLAFGRALDARDRHDMKAAKEECKKIEQADPNFKLARRFCALLPPVWMSSIGIISALEPEVGLGGSSFLAKAAPYAIGALAIGGGIGGYFAATGGGGGGGGGGGSDGGPGSPQLTGASDQRAQPGDNISFTVTCTDPDGTPTRITAQNLPPGASFSQTTDGNPSTGRFTWRTSQSQSGTFSVTFVCTDSGNPPQSTSRTATISFGPATGPTPTPGTCQSLLGSCNADAECCSGACGDGGCCVPDGGSCASANSNSCCNGNCVSSRCCSGLGSSCISNGDCCPGTSCGGGTCCLSQGSACSFNSECCSNNCLLDEISGAQACG